MLLQFSVENHLSIASKQTISLVASSLKDEPCALLRSAALPESHVLPAIVIYGANASGKSNLLAALRFMIDTVRDSHARTHGQSLGRKPFALDKRIGKRPSSFELHFIFASVRYNYGFEIDDKGVRAEWLLSFPNNRQTKLFERKNSSFVFGRALKGRNRIIADLTRSESLFLSSAAQHGHDLLSGISLFIQSIYGDQRLSISAMDFAFTKSQFDSARISTFLGEIGTGVSDVRQQESAFTNAQLEIQREFITAMRSIAKKHVPNLPEPSPEEESLQEKSFVVELGHRAVDGEMVFFDLERESAGTRRLLALLSPIFRALDNGTVLVIDELNASLHTKAADMVLALFCNPATNPNGAQLIATTHDTNLLNSKFLRRDQVWFAEKDANGCSHIYPLSNIKTRKTDNIEDGYLEGRYGGIPVTGDVFELVKH